MVEFELTNLNAPTNMIIPTNPLKKDLEIATHDCEEFAEELANQSARYGMLPAERYLLRFEYGFSGKEMEDAFDVSQSTISKQTRGLRREILQNPALSRIVGQFRVQRAKLQRPNFSETVLFESEVRMFDDTLAVSVTIHNGDPGCTYSWKYRLHAHSKGEEIQKHVLVDYLVDAEYGVMLKRRLRGVSYSLDAREPHFQDKRQYHVYPLPNASVPEGDGTLIAAMQNHTAYDLKLSYNDLSWRELESKLDADRYKQRRSPAYSENDTLLDRLRVSVSTKPISDYAKEKHLRDNLEHLLKIYPAEELDQVPSKTIDLVWNGPLEEYDQDGDVKNALSQALETSQIHRSLTDKGY